LSQAEGRQRHGGRRGDAAEYKPGISDSGKEKPEGQILQFISDKAG